ncbi:unnamed protein product [Brassica rapa subsp. trilocularis]|uniref:(rape) hypothetical protein n=1 Tax=Brassica napus TaxID=3708 RepID=A0A816VYS8_BRANA|nr:unnamed protein product [Brassica napus]
MASQPNNHSEHIKKNLCGSYEIIDGEAGFTTMGNLCSQKDIFVGRCGPNGDETCTNEFVKNGGDRPYSCECNNFGKEHLCRCDFPC